MEPIRIQPRPTERHKASPHTISTLFTGAGTEPPQQALPLPNSHPYLDHPEIILQPIWALPDRTRHALSDMENSSAPPVRR